MYNNKVSILFMQIIFLLFLYNIYKIEKIMSKEVFISFSCEVKDGDALNITSVSLNVMEIPHSLRARLDFDEDIYFNDIYNLMPAEVKNVYKETLTYLVETHEKIRVDKTISKHASLRNNRYNKRIREIELPKFPHYLIKEEIVVPNKFKQKEPFHFENESLKDVIEAIRNNSTINGININKEIKNKSFRFQTNDDPETSLKISELLATFYKDGQQSSPTLGALGRQKSKENADEFAIQMFNVITDLQKQEKVTSYRETARILNEKGIQTDRNGKWHVNTLQMLKKRWKELGLTSPKPDK